MSLLVAHLMIFAREEMQALQGHITAWESVRTVFKVHQGANAHAFFLLKEQEGSLKLNLAGI